MRFAGLKRLKSLVPFLKRGVQYLKEKFKEKLPDIVDYGVKKIKEAVPVAKRVFDEKVKDNPDVMRYLNTHDRTGLGQRALDKISKNINRENVDFLKNQLNNVSLTESQNVPIVNLNRDGFQNLLNDSDNDDSDE